MFGRVLSSYSIEEKVISLIVAVIVLVAGLHGLSQFFRTPDLFVGEGGIYSEGIVSDRSTLINPIFVDFSQANRDISSLVFSGLTKYDPRLKSFVEDLAELTVSEDKKTYRFVLHSNVLWHDGKPLTAEDVYYTFHDVIQHPDFQNPVLKANFEGVAIKQLDDLTVEFALKSPNSFFITNFNVGILPKHLLESVPVVDLPYANFNWKPVGTGPYKVSEPMQILPDGKERVLIVAFEGYYGAAPKIKNVRFNVYRDVQSLIKEQGVLNVISKLTTDFYTEIERNGRFSFTNYELPQYTAVFMNMDSRVLAKYKVRLALQKAIDKTALLKLFTNKIAIDTPLLELKQADWIYKPKVEEAMGALFDSGYKMSKADEGQYRKNAKGEALKLRLLVRAYNDGTLIQQETARLLEFLVNSWREIGVKIELQPESLDVFNERIRKRDYDLLLTGQSLGYNFDTYSYWHSSQASSNGLNLSNYKSFGADALIEKIRDTFTAERKDALLTDLAKTISNDIPAIFLYRPSYVYASDNKLKGVALENLAFITDRFAHIEDWCILCQ